MIHTDDRSINSTFKHTSIQISTSHNNLIIDSLFIKALHQNHNKIDTRDAANKFQRRPTTLFLPASTQSTHPHKQVQYYPPRLGYEGGWFRCSLPAPYFRNRVFSPKEHFVWVEFTLGSPSLRIASGVGPFSIYSEVQYFLTFSLWIDTKSTTDALYSVSILNQLENLQFFVWLWNLKLFRVCVSN